MQNGICESFNGRFKDEWVRSSETGKGFASEGVVALTARALNELGAKRVELVAGEDHTGFRAVAERWGFQLEGVLRNVMRAPDGGLRNSCIYAELSSRAQCESSNFISSKRPRNIR